MVEIVAITPVLTLFLAFLFIQIMTYAKEQIELNRTRQKRISNAVFFQILYYLMLNLTILFIPITINLTWLSLSASETDPVTLDGLITIFRSLSILVWFIYAMYVGLLIIYLIIYAMEKFGVIKPKVEELDEYSQL